MKVSSCVLQTKQWLKNCLLAVICSTTIGVLAEPGARAQASVTATVAAWRLNIAGQYQQLPDDELVTLIGEKPTFCQHPRPDGRVVPWAANGSATPQPLRFSNESGVLRWWSAATPPQLIWSEGNVVAPAAEQLSDQLAVIAQHASPKKLTLVWPEPLMQRYSAVDLTDPADPQALWQWQAPVAGSVQTPVAALLKTATGATSALLMVSGADAVQPAFWLVDAASGTQLASQQYQRAVKTVELPFVLQDLTAAPAVVDRNADGYIDRIYLVDRQGRLVQVDLNDQLQFQSRVVADLSDAAAEFKVQLVASRALLPDYQHLADDDAEATDNGEKMAGIDPAVGPSGKPADVVLLLSTRKEQSQLWVLTIPDSPAFTIQPHHLQQRHLQLDDSGLSTLATAAAAVTAGWYGNLPAAPVSLPQVFAGVLYLPVAASSETCAGARQATQLVARHLFQGTPIYSAEQLAGMPAPFGTPGVIRRSSGELALQDRQQGTLLLPQIRGIRADCRFCTEALHESHYPRWQRMAIYQHETEVY